jgi:UDP-N-acetyl-D-mannosaminuronic acid transferase (WecB/TagA/CpsF family)
MAWISSSSGVEQNFSKAERARVDRTPASETTEALNLTPLLNCRPKDRTQVCVRAQEIFALDGAPLVWMKASNAKVGMTVKRTGFDAVDLLSKKQPETTQERLMES